ncbi:hypothetical protein H096_14293 [Pseudomonas sp. FH1]|nr:hypothetical protein H096_14293 [Pseudomonas sp. FH1]
MHGFIQFVGERFADQLVGDQVSHRGIRRNQRLAKVLDIQIIHLFNQSMRQVGLVQQAVEAFVAGQDRGWLQEEMFGNLQHRLDLAFDSGFAGHVVGGVQQIRDEVDVGADKAGHDNVAITVSQGNGRMQVRQLFFQLLGKLARAGFVLMGTGNLLAQCGGVHESSSDAGVGKGRG